MPGLALCLWLLGWIILMAFAIPTREMRRDPSSPFAYYLCWGVAAGLYLAISKQCMRQAGCHGWFLPLTEGGMLIVVAYELVRRWIVLRRRP